MQGSQVQSPAKPDGVVADILFGSKTAGTVNTPDEQDTVRKVAGMLAKAKQWKATWSKDHERWWNLWESNHYKGRISKTLTQAVINQVWGAIETFVGHVTDALPEPIARGREMRHQGKAKKASKWLKYAADVNDLEQNVQHPTREACVVGAGWMEVGWDPQALHGRGDCAITPKDGKFIYTSPHARNLKEALYLIEASNVPREYVERNWPDKGGLVPPGATDQSLTNVRSFAEDVRDRASPDFAQLTTTTGSDSAWVGSQMGATGQKQTDLVTLVKCYIRQNDGTMRLIVIANNVVLQDGPSPYDDDDFPYAVFNVLPTMDTIQGRGLVQFIEGLQHILNTSISTLLDQQRFASDPMLVVDAENLEEGQLIDNSPGSVLPNSSQRGQGYYWLQAPGFNQAWVEIQKVIGDYMDSVLGNVDIMQGERPVGVNTLGGLEIVREQANVRVRNLIRWIKASLKRVYLLTLSRYRQFAKDERTIRVLGKFGQEEFEKLNPVTGISPTGEPEQDMTLPEDAEFDIEFGKEPPGGRQAQVEMAITLASTPAEDGLPMVDRQYVLEKAIEDEAPEVLERMAAMAEQQAQAQAAEAQAQQEAAPAEAQAGDPVDEMLDVLMGEAA